jgi:ribosomal protein L18E
MPLYMRLGKLRGANHRKSMPMGPFRTYTTPVNISSLDRFDEGVEVTPELLRSAGVVRSLKHPIKILGKGELSTKLTVTAHAFSKRAVEAIEAAGGKAVRVDGAPAIAEPEPVKAKAKSKRAPKAAAAPEPEAAEPEAEEPDAEPEPEADADAEE